MKSIVKQPIVWIGLVVFIVLFVIVMAQVNGNNNVSNKTETQEAPSSDKNVVMSKQSTEQAQTIEHVHEANSQLDENTNHKVPRHDDMLSEEMKQAIRDKLLFHGPMKVITHPDGSIELPANGRFTQMPVAVEMPDGSIQIKEYSSLPE
jgi:hypothetical protein